MPTQEEDEIKYLIPGSQSKPRYDWNEAIGGENLKTLKDNLEAYLNTR